MIPRIIFIPQLIKSDSLRGLIFKYYKEIENNKFIIEQSAFVNNHEITIPETYAKVIATSESFARYNITLPLPELNLENLTRDQKFSHHDTPFVSRISYRSR